MRYYKRQVANIAVIFYGDAEFGEVEYTPRRVSQKRHDFALPEYMIAHLENDANASVSVFTKQTDLFFGAPEIAKVGQHRISLKEGHVPRRSYLYRIPETLRCEVTKQI